MTEGRLETESRCRECLAIIKGEVTSNNLSKRRVRIRTHGVVGGRGLVAPSYPIGAGGGTQSLTRLICSSTAPFASQYSQYPTRITSLKTIINRFLNGIPFAVSKNFFGRCRFVP